MPVPKFRRRDRSDRGASAVEFALVLLPLLYLVFGIMQYGWYFYSMQTGTSAVGDAVRRLTVGDCTDTTELRTFLDNRLGSATTASAAQLSPSVTYSNEDGTTTPKVGGTVRLELTYPTLDMKFPFIPIPNDGNVTRAIVGRVEDTTPSGAGCS